MDNNPLTMLPPLGRKILYAAYGTAGLVSVAWMAYVVATDQTAPNLLVGGTAALAALVPAFSVLAASNVMTAGGKPGGDVDGTMTVGGDLAELPTTEPDEYDDAGNPVWHAVNHG